MNKKINYRDYRKEDFKSLSDIVRTTWHYDEFCSLPTAKMLADVFLRSCLANQTYIKVAVVDDIPVGVIMGKNINKHHCPFDFRCQEIKSIIKLYLSKEGRQVSQIFKNVNQLDKQLLEESPISYQGEVAFFAVNSQYRGYGIGKQLFHFLLDYMKQEHVKDFFLFTDTSCNYQFYEHQGMKKRGQKCYSFAIEQQTCPMNFFIYDYHL